MKTPHNQSYVHRTTDLMPDGVRIIVDWGSMRIGMSAFVPCINTAECKTQLSAVAKTLGWRITSVARIESNRSGVRFWRIM